MKSTALIRIALAATALPKQCRAGWIDPDSPDEAFSTTSHYAEDTREYELVFSDEFEQDGRSFDDGSDPRWTAIDKNDYTNEALHFYRPQNVQTTNGVMNITTIRATNKYKAFDEKKLKYYADAKHIQTGMVQGWNKFCMTGGIIEFSAKLPGDPKVGGLWPALWMLGNLARATYVGSSNFIWPYSYNECDEKNRHSQKISACSKVGHYGMKPGQGRGSPEIDILEAMMGSPEKLPNTNITRPYFSTSLQIAPGLEGVRPQLGKLPKKGHGHWYEGLEYGSNNTQLNPFFYGVTLEHKPKQFTYQSDAISANTHLMKEFFQEQHKYRVEWDPPNADGTEGYLRWYLDGKFLYGIKGENLQLTGTEIPSEPMYLIMNTAVASSWGFPKPCPEGCKCECYECGNPECSCGLPDGFCENLPASFEIEYVRAYQAKDDAKHNLGCSTKERPTSKFIQGHKKDYMNTEEGQKEPLMAIQRGGGYCSKDSDCGYPSKGSCSGRGHCVCHDDFTGPMCLSHFGYDDNPPVEEDLEVDKLSFSPIFLAMIVFALVAFVFFVIADARRRRQAESYNVLPSSDNSAMKVDSELVRAIQQGAGGGSYQQSSGKDYNSMGTNKLETVTYSMIDGRLLEES
mmetsp:Transcript_40583/g.85189  ORF Transcript_40583/g.85189 Transcript_40583/m.85189 type:complete len:628 (+) Transcript_40583:141-2024(+)